VPEEAMKQVIGAMIAGLIFQAFKVDLYSSDWWKVLIGFFIGAIISSVMKP
jgi:uncharacterized membrane protein YeaQ/YmgE (transglycosylase-associated protein family)